MIVKRARLAVAFVVATVLSVGMAVGHDGPAYARREGGGRQPHAQPSRQNEDLYGCDRTFGRPPEGHLKKLTSPGGDDPVHAGDTVGVTLIWSPEDWTSDQLHKVLDCVAIDGRLEPSMQSGESPTDNDGRFATSYRVPSNAAEGTRICDQAMISGPSPRGDYDRQISNQVCHTVTKGGSAARPPCERCGEERPCSGRCGEQGSCDRGCAEKSPCDRGCAEKSPCDRGCAERSPCDRGCADESPCDRGCADSPPPCDRRCDDRGEKDRRGEDCRRCDRDHRGGVVRRLIGKLF